MCSVNALFNTTRHKLDAQNFAYDFSTAFSWYKMPYPVWFFFSKSALNGEIDNKWPLIEAMASTDQATSHYPNQDWPSSLPHRGQWVNTLGPRQNSIHLADVFFSMHFWMKTLACWITFRSVPSGPFNNNPTLVLIMAWRRTGAEPVSALMVV